MALLRCTRNIKTTYIFLLGLFITSAITGMDKENTITIIGNNTKIATHRKIAKQIPAMQRILTPETQEISLEACGISPIQDEILEKAISIAHHVYVNKIEFNVDRSVTFTESSPHVIDKEESAASWQKITSVWYALKNLGFSWADRARSFLCIDIEEASTYTTCIFDASKLGLKSIAPFYLLEDTLRNISTLHLSCNNLQHISEDMFPDLPHLEVLDLSSNRIISFEENCFSNLPQISIIDLSGNHFSQMPTGIFDTLQHLETIYLHNNPQLPQIETQESIKHAFGNVKSLKILLLRSNEHYSPAIQENIKNELPHVTIEFVSS